MKEYCYPILSVPAIPLGMGGSAIYRTPNFFKRTSTGWLASPEIKTRKTDQDEFRYCSMQIAQDQDQPKDSIGFSIQPPKSRTLYINRGMKSNGDWLAHRWSRSPFPTCDEIARGISKLLILDPKSNASDHDQRSFSDAACNSHCANLPSTVKCQPTARRLLWVAISRPHLSLVLEIHWGPQFNGNDDDKSRIYCNSNG